MQLIRLIPPHLNYALSSMHEQNMAREGKNEVKALKLGKKIVHLDVCHMSHSN